MAFQIKKGLSTNLFNDIGELLITPEEGCWYITTDTYRLYSCFNGIVKEVGDIGDFDSRISNLEERVDGIVQVYGYKNALPLVGNEGTIYTVTDENAQYRWDSSLQTYVAIGRDYQEITIINGGNAQLNTTER